VSDAQRRYLGAVDGNDDPEIRSALPNAERRLPARGDTAEIFRIGDICLHVETEGRRAGSRRIDDTHRRALCPSDGTKMPACSHLPQIAGVPVSIPAFDPAAQCYWPVSWSLGQGEGSLAFCFQYASERSFWAFRPKRASHRWGTHHS
jgi:hypothetical protein